MHPRRLAFLAAVLIYSAIGHCLAASKIPFGFRDGMIWVKVAVSGQNEELNFLIDSGAGATVVDLAAARRLSLTLGDRQTVEGVHNRSVAYRVKGFDARVGSVALAASPLAVDLSGPSAGCHQRIDGLIGADFFRTRVVQIDYASQVVRLLEKGEINASGCEVLPLSVRNDAFCARIAINDGPSEWLRVDTGCNSGLEWVVTGRRAKTGIPTIGVNARSTREIRTDVQLAGTKVKAVRTGVHASQMFSGEAGLIGNELLSRFTVTIDAPGRRCLLANR